MLGATPLRMVYTDQKLLYTHGYAGPRCFQGDDWTWERCKMDAEIAGLERVNRVHSPSSEHQKLTF